MSATAITSLGEVTEVPEKARRGTHTVDYKLQIVKEAEACTGPGDIGALLRHEGLYSSHLTTWRQARDRGELAPGAKARKRGPTTTAPDPRDKRIAELERQNAKLTTRAERAEAIAEIRKSGRAAGASIPERGIVMETVALSTSSASPTTATACFSDATSIPMNRMLLLFSGSAREPRSRRSSPRLSMRRTRRSRPRDTVRAQNAGRARHLTSEDFASSAARRPFPSLIH